MDAEKFRTSVVPLYRGLFAAARRVVGGDDDASDIVQETMTKLWDIRDQLDSVERIDAFAFTVMKRLALDFVRAQTRRQVQSLDDSLGYEINTAENGDTNGDIEAVELLMGQLSDRQQQIIRLSAYDNHSPDEISKITGLTTDNVRQCLSRGRRKLRELYIHYLSTI